VARTTDGGGAIAPPEPDLTPEEMIRRAVAMRPKLVRRQAEVEELRYYPEDLHEAFERAGFYRVYLPRRYGGYEFDVSTYARLAIELARGCPNSAWCLLLAANHALQIGSWWPESAQAEIFGDGDFRCASVAAPLSEPAVRRDDGWELNGKVSYCSGIPYSTHYMGQALMAGAAPDGPPPMLLFVVERSEWTMLDDWGDLLGLKGSGSHSITFDRGHVPAHWALENTMMVDVDVSAGTPGYALHGNPLYHGRALAPFTLSLAAILVGAAYGALDDYQRLMEERTIPLPPFTMRRLDPDYQRHFGRAMAKIATAEAAVLHAADRHMELCTRAAERGDPYGHGEDWFVACIGREAMIQAWETVQADIFRTAGSSAARSGERIERVYRDMSMGNGHLNTLLRDLWFREIARWRLGLPKLAGNPRSEPLLRAAGRQGRA
jgi:3-hydroxy-9,10-secoandrosta-1,3,5(10)-triene-9,17-dione monooxygenase